MPEEKKRIGDILVDRGLITKEDLEQALEVQTEGEDKYLGELLLDWNYIDKKKLEQALEIQKSNHKKLDEILVEKGYVPKKQLEDLQSLLHKNLFVSLEERELSPEIVKMIPYALAKRFRMVVISKDESMLTVAMVNPRDVVAIDNIRNSTGCQVKAVLSTKKDILAAINKYYEEVGAAEGDVSKSIQDLAKVEIGEIKAEGEEEVVDTAQLKVQADDPPVVRYVNLVLMRAVEEGASDLHLEPGEKEVFVRQRVDGKLRELPPPPKKIYPAIVSRVKILSKLDIAERRLPQDGRAKAVIGPKSLDLRISTLPCIYGEKIVMRLLDKSGVLLDLEKLGFEGDHLTILKKNLVRAYGMILLTGPTGSGKTTTLYTGLNHINTPEKNIITVEDPVEYELRGINQTQVRANIGLTFARCLRTILRQDPDVIMIGEVRDLETAEIAVKAALTGHLVFSTLHTNDAISVVSRLGHMGVEPFLIASSLNLAIAQRLVRRICANCKEPYTVDSDDFANLGIPKGTKLYQGKGCDKCNNSGYKGRSAVHEMFELTSNIRKMVLERKDEDTLRAEAKETQGMLSLQEVGVKKALAGVTT